MDFLIALGDKKVGIIKYDKLLRAISAYVNIYIENKPLCLRALKIFNFCLFDGISKYIYIISSMLIHFLLIENNWIEVDMSKTIKRIIETHINDAEVCKTWCNFFVKVFEIMDGK